MDREGPTYSATCSPKRWLSNPAIANMVAPYFFIAAASGAFTIEDLESGSAYITELRLRWVTAFRNHPLPRPPIVVQVLGDQDDVVGRDDSLDVEFMEGATRIDIPGAEHGDLVDLASASDPTERYDLLWHCVQGLIGSRAIQASRHESAADLLPAARDQNEQVCELGW